MRDNILLSSGLGEEVLSSYKEEKQIKFLTKKLDKMIEENINTEEMARRIISDFFKDKKDEQF